VVFAASDGRLTAQRYIEPDMTSRHHAPVANGTYILLAELGSPATIEIGKIGSFLFAAGTYAYVGSAFGPGGLAARLGRYASGARRKHWHIDFLLDQGEVVGALVRTDEHRRECAWANWTANRGLRKVPNFGSSDCRCKSHLFFVGNDEKAEEMVRAAGCELKATYLDRRNLTGGR
jgi:Uri superfamily endonuclease